MERVIGIDFGTSTTYMNVKRYNGTKPLEDAFTYMPVMFNYGESSGYVSTIVRENADGTFDFGEKASEQMEGAKIYTEMKMQLEAPDEAKRNEARRIVKAFFKYLYNTYSQQAANLGSADDKEETVISYPVKWQEETQEFMLEAAREAGFQNVRGMDEATAAVSTVLCHNAGKELIEADKPGCLLLVDMGAGTTDLVVCRYQVDMNGNLNVELVNNWPRDASEPCFGGRDVDRVLEGYVEAYLTKALNPALAASANVIATTPGQAKMWKERNVSVNLADNKPVTTCGYLSAYKAMGMLSSDFPAFGRKDFQEFSREQLLDYVSLIEGCLTDTARKNPDFEEAGVDLVILTGGHSSWYFAREIIDGSMEGYTDHPALASVRQHKDHIINLSNPQTTVSLGLVYSKLPFNLKRSEPSNDPPREHPVDPPSSDGELLREIRKIMEDEPHLCTYNQLSNTTDVAYLRGIFEVTNGEQILFARNSYDNAFLMTDRGIYQRQKNVNTFLSWKEFANSRNENGEQYVTYSSGGKSIISSVANWQILKKLYNELRKLLGITKPPSGDSAHWDSRLRPIIKEFVQNSKVLKQRTVGLGCLDRYQPDALLRHVELNNLVGDEVYYAASNYDGSFWGRNKEIITSSGFSMRRYIGFIFGYSGEFITWSEFIEADLYDDNAKVSKVLNALKLRGEFIKLQQLLRKKSAELHGK